MRLTPFYLKSLITEVLNEKLYGKRAILYTASKAPPEEYVSIVNGDKIDPGKGFGAVYGKGLYTVYDEENSDMKTSTFSGRYGRYLYKIRQNIDNFICFDEEPCIKVWGSSISPHEQAMRAIGKHEVKKKEKIISEEDLKLFKKLPAKNGQYEDGSYSQPVALKFVNIFRGMMAGIMFTHDPNKYKDGHVCVVFDPSSSLIIAHADLLGGSQERMFTDSKIEPVYDKIEEIKWTKADLSSSKTISYKTPNTSRFDAKNKQQKINVDYFANDYRAIRKLLSKKTGRTYENYYPEIVERTKSMNIVLYILRLINRIPEGEVVDPDASYPKTQREELYNSISKAIYKNTNFTFETARNLALTFRSEPDDQIEISGHFSLSPLQMFINSIVAKSPKTEKNVQIAMDSVGEDLYGITNILQNLDEIDEETIKNIVVSHPRAESSGILKKVAWNFPHLVNQGVVGIKHYYDFLRDNVESFDPVIKQHFPENYERILYYFLSFSDQKIVDLYMKQFEWKTLQQVEVVKNWKTKDAPFLIKIVLENLKRLLSNLDDPEKKQRIYELTLRAVKQNPTIADLADKRKKKEQPKGLEKQIVDKILDFPAPDGWEIITNDDLLSNILVTDRTSESSINFSYKEEEKLLEFDFYIKPKGDLEQILLNPESAQPVDEQEAEKAFKDYINPFLVERGLEPLGYVDIFKETSAKFPCYSYDCATR